MIYENYKEYLTIILFSFKDGMTILGLRLNANVTEFLKSFT